MVGKYQIHVKRTLASMVGKYQIHVKMTLASMVGKYQTQANIYRPGTGATWGRKVRGRYVHNGTVVRAKRYGGTGKTVRWYGQNGTGAVPGQHRLVSGCKDNMGAKRYGGDTGKTVWGRYGQNGMGAIRAKRYGSGTGKTVRVNTKTSVRNIFSCCQQVSSLLFYAQSTITVISGRYTFCRYTITVNKNLSMLKTYMYSDLFIFKQS